MTASAVFGDITGVLKETKDSYADDTSDLLNELHHRQFAVSWNRHDYELDPKACIEDIFHGGTGFKNTNGTSPPPGTEKSIETRPSYTSEFENQKSDGIGKLLSEEEDRTDLRSWTVKTIY